MTEQMASSDKKRKPLVGLRVIEVWCWLWLAGWLWIAHHALGFDAPQWILFVGIFISLVAALGLRSRKLWARRLTNFLGVLGILISPLVLPFLWESTESVSSILELALVVLALLGFCPWMIYYLTRPHVKEAFAQ
jgi:hypothetical protein